jgi:hypothetical protein
MNKKLSLILSIFLFSIIIFTSFSVAADVCCEKTKQGAWCQNDDAANCAAGYLKTPTNCDSTSYCKTGTCIDRSEGRCISNTPQTLCEEQNGFWDSRPVEEITECQIGCCFFENGDTTPVTQTRCRSLASMRGLEIKEFRSSMTDQFECLASATSPEKGACVIDNGVERDCKHLTRSECNSLKTDGVTTEFSEDYLCSADFLGTICGASEKTTCVEDLVYFVDTCGNIANVYDSTKQDDSNYWTRMIPPEDSCGFRESNSLSPTCGNCNYGLGSYCEAYERGKYPNNPKPVYGDYICSDLSCRDGVFAEQFRDENGRYPLHGESWCTTNAFEYSDLSNPQNKAEQVNLFAPGEESYVLRCSNGEVTPESCSTGEWRQKICREYVDSETEVHYGGCIQNTWMDCLEQTTQEECEDLQERDCVWFKGHSIYRDENNNPLSLDLNEEPVEATCIPKYSPAFDFWNPDSTSPEICKLASTTCVVKLKIDLLANAKNYEEWESAKLESCVSNCYCLEGYDREKTDVKDKDEDKYLFSSHEEWLETMTTLCSSLGDCGTEVNYIGETGYYDSEDELVDSEYFRKRKEFEEWANSQAT